MILTKKNKKYFAERNLPHLLPMCGNAAGIVDASFMMTKEGTFTMISRAVVVRHLGGLLCAVGPMVSLF